MEKNNSINLSFFNHLTEFIVIKAMKIPFNYWYRLIVPSDISPDI